jgi:hypothetical protein
MTGIVPVHPLPKLPTTKVLTGGTTTIVNTVAGPTLSHDIAAWATFGQVSTLGSNIPKSEVAYDTNSGLVRWGPFLKNYNALSNVDWTIEGWYYLKSWSNDAVVVEFAKNTTPAFVNSFCLGITPTGTLNVYTFANSTNNVPTSTKTFTANRWSHCVWTRSGTSLYTFIDGVSSSALTAPSQLNSLTDMNMLTLGSLAHATPAFHLNGKCSQVKISLGAKYSGGTNFTPAFDLTPSQSDNTVLLFLGRKGEDTPTGQILPVTTGVTTTTRPSA